MNSLMFRRLMNTGAAAPLAVLVVMAVVFYSMRPSQLSSDGLSTMFNSLAALALAACGAALITIVGGFDFSVGAALSLINVVVATRVSESTGSQLLMIAVAIGIGLGIGLVNGLIVTRLRVAPIVATLATSFLWGGLALLVLDRPGGAVPYEFTTWFTGIVIGVPIPLLAIGLLLVWWTFFKRSRLGRSIYAVGGDRASAHLHGIRTERVVLAAYLMAGAMYGMSALFLTALTSSGDPNVGGALLLPVFAALAIGGVRFGGGRGDIAGAVIGALILYMISDLLYAFGISSFYTQVFNGVLLLVAVISPKVVSSIRTALWTRRIARSTSDNSPADPEVHRV